MLIICRFMRRNIHRAVPILVLFLYLVADAQQIPESKGLEVILIRHGEKPLNGDNLNCAGLNRAMQLPRILSQRFGVPSYIYVPSLSRGKSTKHARMFQTIMPLAVKYNLTINSKYNVEQVEGLAKDVLQKKGIVLIVWEHKALAQIAQDLGVQQSGLQWMQDDFDSIWVIRLDSGSAMLDMQKAGLHPASSCAF